MVRFYHLDPERLINMPTYLVGNLARYLPALEASEQLAAITTGMVPMVDKTIRNDVIHALDRRRAVLLPTQEPPKIELIEYNPAKAKAYFEALGTFTTAKD